MVVTQLTIDRALRIMDSLIKALEKRDFQIIVEPSEITYSTHVVILGEKIPIKIEEIESGNPGRLALWFWKIWGEGLDTDTRDIRQHRLEGMLNFFYANSLMQQVVSGLFISRSIKKNKNFKKLRIAVLRKNESIKRNKNELMPL